MLNTLTDSITESQLYADLNTRIDLIETLEDYTGYLASYTGDNLVTRLNANDIDISSINTDVANVQTSLDNNVTSINNNITSINTNISNIQTAINDLVSGTTAVFVQATAPVDSPPGTIAEFSRWYDSDDNNTVYVWIDQGSGLEWVSLEDPRIGANEADIVAIEAQVFNPDGSARLATATALSTLDTTVVNLVVRLPAYLLT